MSLGSIAGTMAGGAIRTLSAPFRDDPCAPAARAVLASWCYANGLTPNRMREQDGIEIHPLDPGELARDRHEIHWRQTLAGDPGTHGLGTQLRKTPLLLEPAGLLAGELTCGHVLTSPSVVLGAPALLFVCDQHIDPRTDRHPGQHTGDWAGEHRPPSAGGPVRERHDSQPRRMSWDNEHPGEQPFRDGLPYIGDLAPAAAHEVVLARLAEIVARRPRVNRRQSLIALASHTAGLRDIAERHAPSATVTPAAGGPLCERRCSGWPCPDYRAAFAGIVAFGGTR